MTSAATSPAWDVVVVTAGSTRQRSVYEARLADRVVLGDNDTGHSPEYIVFCDHTNIDGAVQRQGDGLSSLGVLRFLRQRYGGDDTNGLFRRRVIVVHAGGLSTRLATQSCGGKLFALLPDTRGGGDNGKTRRPFDMLDLILDMYAPLAALLDATSSTPRAGGERGRGCVLFVASDVIVAHESGPQRFVSLIDEWLASKTNQMMQVAACATVDNIDQPAVYALAHPSPLPVATRHGVFVFSSNSSLDGVDIRDDCCRVLQKPSLTKLTSTVGAIVASPDAGVENAVDEKRFAWTDSAYWLNAAAVDRLVAFYERHIHAILAYSGSPLSFYADFMVHQTGFGVSPGLSATGTELADDSGGGGGCVDLAMLIADEMRRIALRIVTCRQSQFRHVGTAREYAAVVASAGDTVDALLTCSQYQAMKTASRPCHHSPDICYVNCRRILDNICKLGTSSSQTTLVIDSCRLMGVDQQQISNRLFYDVLTTNCGIWSHLDMDISLLARMVASFTDFIVFTAGVVDEASDRAVGRAGTHYVTVAFHATDDLKRVADDYAGLAFAGRRGSLTTSPSLPYNGHSRQHLSLWTAALFVKRPTRRQSLNATLTLVEDVASGGVVSVNDDDECYYSMARLIEKFDARDNMLWERSCVEDCQ